MAQLHDIPRVFRTMGFISFAKKVWAEVSDDNLFTWASALAYSWLFALFPFFLVLLSMLPLLRDEWKHDAVQYINEAIDQTLAADARKTVHDYIAPKLDQMLNAPPKGVWSVGLLVAVWAASGGMAMTMASMDKCYDVPKSRPIYRQRPLAVGLTLIVASMIIAVIVLIPIGTLVTNWLTTNTDRLLQRTPAAQPARSDQTPAQVSATAPSTNPTSQPAKQLAKPRQFALFLVIWQIVRYGLALLLMFWVVALIYYYGPNVPQRFRVLTPGSVFTVAVWILLGVSFRIYVERFGKYGETYGAVGGVIILLFFFYLDALVLLVGAEINAEIDCATGASACLRAKPGEEEAVPTP